MALVFNTVHNDDRYTAKVIYIYISEQKVSGFRVCGLSPRRVPFCFDPLRLTLRVKLFSPSTLNP